MRWALLISLAACDMPPDHHLTEPVTDRADLLDPIAEERLAGRIEQLRSSEEVDLAILTVTRLSAEPVVVPEHGVVLVVAPGALRIEVARDLRTVIGPDVVATLTEAATVGLAEGGVEETLAVMVDGITRVTATTPAWRRLLGSPALPVVGVLVAGAAALAGWLAWRQRGS
ncbi:MAG: TPM domain-containing protein [Myxococcales bacterium]|nr:TPM domain-containing protein [Myxococcales bacterium]